MTRVVVSNGYARALTRAGRELAIVWLPVNPNKLHVRRAETLAELAAEGAEASGRPLPLVFASIEEASRHLERRMVEVQLQSARRGAERNGGCCRHSRELSEAVVVGRIHGVELVRVTCMICEHTWHEAKAPSGFDRNQTGSEWYDGP